MQAFSTTDFHLATSLYTLGYRLIRVDKSDPRRAVFVFENNDDIEADAAAFFEDQLSLNPRQYAANSRLLKERLRGV